MKYLDELLQLFVSEDNLRPALTQSNRIKDHVYASSGRMAIKIPVNQLKKKYESNPKFPNILSVFENEEPQKPEKIDVCKIKSALSELEKENVYHSTTHKCSACDGVGECSECGQDCPSCDGCGDMERENKQKVIGTHYILYQAVKLGANYFDPNYMDALARVAEEVKSAIIVDGNISMKPCFFSVGKVKVVLMPKGSDGNESVAIIKKVSG